MLLTKAESCSARNKFCWTRDDFWEVVIWDLLLLLPTNFFPPYFPQFCPKSDISEISANPTESRLNRTHIDQTPKMTGLLPPCSPEVYSGEGKWLNMWRGEGRPFHEKMENNRLVKDLKGWKYERGRGGGGKIKTTYFSTRSDSTLWDKSEWYWKWKIVAEETHFDPCVLSFSCDGFLVAFMISQKRSVPLHSRKSGLWRAK